MILTIYKQDFYQSMYIFLSINVFILINDFYKYLHYISCYLLTSIQCRNTHIIQLIQLIVLQDKSSWSQRSKITFRTNNKIAPVVDYLEVPAQSRAMPN